MRYALILFVASLASACVAGDDNDTNNANGLNNVNAENNLNSANNTNNVVADMGMEDLGGEVDMGDDMLITEGLTCTIIDLAPFTIPVGEETKVTVTALCDGVGEAESLPINVKVFPEERGVDVGDAVANFAPGEVTFEIVVPPMDIDGDNHPAFSISSEDDFVAFDDTATSAEFRIRKRPDLLTAEWDDVLDQELPPPRPNATLMQAWSRDVNADGQPDYLALWRDGSDVILSSKKSPDYNNGFFMAHSVGVDVSKTVKEGWHLGRLKGVNDDQKMALYWWGVDNAGQLFAMTTAVNEGNIGTPTLFDSVNGSAATVKELIDVDIAEDVDVTDGFQYELIFLFRGDANGKGVFQTVGTRRSSSKLVEGPLMDTLAGYTATQHQNGEFSAGLLRPFDGVGDERLGPKFGTYRAWTFEKLTGSGKVTAVSLFGPTPAAGQSIGGLDVPGVDAAEKNFYINTFDADGDGDLDLALTNDGTHGTNLRIWQTDNGAPVASSLTFPLTSKGKTTARKFLASPNGGPSFVTSVQHPFQLKAATEAGSTDTHFFGVMSEVQLPNGLGSMPVYSIYDSVGTPGAKEPVVEYPITLGTKTDFAQYAAGEAVHLNTTSTGFNATVVSANDTPSVIVATNDLATVLYTEGGYVFLDERAGVQETLSDLPEYVSKVAIFEDKTGAATDGTKILAFTGESNGTPIMKLWMTTNAGLEGPATLTLPAGVETFDMAGYQGDTLMFASPKVGEFRTLSWAVSELYTLIKGKTKVSEADVSMALTTHAANPGLRFPGVGVHPVIHYRHRKERRAKRRVAHRMRVAGIADEGDTETVVVVANDESDACPFQTVLYAGDPETVSPDTIAESADERCLDLAMPVASADFCGVGGTQFMTAKVEDPSAAEWTWVFWLWMRSGPELYATEFGRYTTAKDVFPTVSSGDINGDFLDDLVIVADGVTVPIFSDGVGGSIGEAGSLDGFSDFVGSVPGSSSGLGGGQTACGNGLQCAFGSGTKQTTSKTSGRPQLL